MGDTPGTRLKQVFAAAVDIEPGPEREAYLDWACADAPGLRLQVAALLRAHDGAGDFLDSSADPARSGPGGDASGLGPISTAEDPIHRPTLLEGPGSIVGPYKLLQRIGEGGMGTVFMAEQERPIRRKVALKVIKAGMDTAQVIARFEAERQALAMMDHPNIARVLDVGATATGRPYFVMELVRGVPITEYCERNRLAPRDRLALFIPVCRAIQHAHQKGIIHRDIKPSNVLVALHDGIPEPRVIDFGVAKAIEHRLTERTMFTEFGAVIGTLEYMSPEQAEMGALDIDTRSDIYSLGVLLYEILTGSTPLRRGKIRDAAYSEVLRLICHEEPSKPSARLFEPGDDGPSISPHRKVDPTKLSRLIRGELDWIVMKSLEKDRTRRYETATGFARDLQRYLDGDPVEAGPPSAAYRLSRFARKHRAGIVTAGLFALILVTATATSLALLAWANQQLGRAILAEEAAQDRVKLAIDAVRRFGEVVRENPELKTDPRLGPLRLQLLGEPIKFFRELNDRLHRDREASPESIARLAAASSTLALLLQEVGNKEDALRFYDQARSLWERLHRSHPADVVDRVELARQQYHIGFLQAESGRTVEALQAFDHARRLQERLVVEAPEDSELMMALGTTCHAIGNLQAELGRRDEALAAFEQALPLWERLERGDPSKITHSGDRLWAQTNIAELRRDPRGIAAALAGYEAARKPREQLYEENKTSVWHQLDIAANHLYMGKLLQATPGRLPDALATYRQIIPIWRKLIEGDSLQPRFRIDLARTYHQAGLAEGELGRPAEAEVAFGEAGRLWDGLVEEHPNNAIAAVGLAATLRLQAALLAGRDDRPAAVALLRRGEAALGRALAANPGHHLILQEQEQYRRSWSQSG